MDNKVKLLVEVPDSIRRNIKIEALRQKRTMAEIVVEALRDYITAKAPESL